MLPNLPVEILGEIAVQVRVARPRVIGIPDQSG